LPSEEIDIFDGARKVTDLTPLKEEDFTGCALDKECILAILDYGWDLARKISGDRYYHDVSDIYIGRDNNNVDFKNASWAKWYYDPPVIVYGRDYPFIGRDGLPNFATLFQYCPVKSRIVSTG
jgi:hypothetical protein